MYRTALATAFVRKSRRQERQRLFTLHHRCSADTAATGENGCQIIRQPTPSELSPALSATPVTLPATLPAAPTGWLNTKLHYANCRVSPPAFWIFASFSAALSGLAGSYVCSWQLLGFFFAAGGYLPFAWLERRSVRRAEEFAADYPTVILATAASMKAGMNVYSALERSVQLLEPQALVRLEVSLLLERLRNGAELQAAVEAFGAGIRQPELQLFRTGFLLVVEHGGRFAPTLERLARVTRDRSLLIQAARVSTTTMRMTANALLVIAPLIVFMIAVRTANFWEIILQNSLANLLASIGVAIIGCSYVLLQRMSSFKP